MTDDRADPALADRAVPDVGVAIPPRTEREPRIVEVDHLEAIEPDGAIESLQRPVILGGGTEIWMGDYQLACNLASRKPEKVIDDALSALAPGFF